LADRLNKRFVLRGHIGSGQQGSVLLASDQEGETKEVAIKLVGQANRGSLILEFERLASVSHPGLAGVVGLFEADRAVEPIAQGALYFASEYIDGPSLEEEVAAKQGLERVEVLLDIAAQLASALSHLHSHELVHGDIKPDNIRRSRAEDRVVLLDLGLARAPGPGPVQGSVAYMAPEALSGYADPRSDLYNLGATLFEYALGERLFPEESSNEVIAAILRSTSSAIKRRLGAFPAPFTELLSSLLASDPSDRPSGANALLAHISRVREALRLPGTSSARSANFSRPEFVGRRSELAALAQVLSSHVSGESLSRSLPVLGKAGSGRSRLIDEAILRQQAECARKERTPARVYKGTLEELWPKSCPDAATFVEHYARESQDPVLLVVHDDEDPRVDALLRASIPRHLLILACAPPAAVEGAISLSALSAEQTTELCQSLSPHPVPESWTDAVHRLSQGLPGRICEFMQAAASLDPHFSETPDALLVNGSFSASLLRRVSTLTPLATDLLEALAVAQRPLASSDLMNILDVESSSLARASQELVLAGLLHYEGDHLRCASRHYATVIDEALPAARRRSLHRRALSQAGDSLPLFDRARHLQIVGPAAQAGRIALEAIDERCRAGRHDQALRLCLASARQMSGKAASLHAARTAEVALTTGDYQLATESAEKARRSRDTSIQRRAANALARCAQHRGDMEEATALLSSLVAQFPDDPVPRASFAKTLLAQGELPHALAEAETVLAQKAEGSERFLAREVAGLANLYLGQLEAAGEHFSVLPEIAEQADDMRLMGRAQGLQGMQAQREGQLRQAAALYQEAARNSAQSGAIHAAAVFSLNGATIEQQSGRYAAALDALQVALRDLRRSGTPFELAAAHCNRGNVLLALGEHEAAAEEARVAQDLAHSASEPRLHYFAHLLMGDIALRKQILGVAREHYENACSLAEEHQLSDGLLAHLALSEVQAMAGDMSSADLASTTARRLTGTRRQVPGELGPRSSDPGPGKPGDGRRARRTLRATRE
jgi:serine/threonine protein kinase/tetratricopeptide (TPR) repeat protein